MDIYKKRRSRKEQERETVLCSRQWTVFRKKTDIAATERLKERIRRLERELYYVWDYIGQEGYWNEAREYVAEHVDEATPFESLL